MKDNYKGYKLWIVPSMEERGVIFGFIEKDGIRCQVTRKARKTIYHQELVYASPFGSDKDTYESASFNETEAGTELFAELKGIVDAIEMFASIRYEEYKSQMERVSILNARFCKI